MSSTHRRLALILVLCVEGGVTPLHGQGVLKEASRNSQIQIEPVAVLSFRGSDAAPDVLSRVFRVGEAHWGVSSSTMRGTVTLFNDRGQEIRKFGREGKGPGEYVGPVVGAMKNGELWVVDARNQRLTRLSPDLKLLGTRQLPGRVHNIGATDRGDKVLLSGFFQGPRGSSVVARVGADPQSDAIGGVVAETDNPWLQRVHAAEVNGDVWAFATSGGRIQILRQSDLSVSEWLRIPYASFATPAPFGGPRGGPRRMPPPYITGVMTDHAGILWVLAMQPDARWSPDDTMREEWRTNYDTFVIAIDPQARTIVAHTTIDDVCHPVEGAVASCVDELGESVHLRRLKLVR